MTVYPRRLHPLITQQKRPYDENDKKRFPMDVA